jgi:signal transduction histidine kinase
MSAQPPEHLAEWRARVTGSLVMVILAVVTPVLVLVLIRDRAAVLRAQYLGLYAVLVALAAFRRLDYRLRAGVLVLIGLALAALVLHTRGLEGAGRLLLLGAPIQALFLLGRSSGLAAGVAAMGTYVAVALHTLSTGYAPPMAPTDGAMWLMQGLVLAALLATTGLLADRVLAFQEQLRARARASANRLAEALSARDERVAQLDAEVARRHELERELLEVAERERQRVGHELHDGVCQQLTAGHVAARLLERQLAADGSTAAPQAAALAELLETTHGEARDLARGLTPSPLRAGTLGAALTDLARHVRETVEVDCDFVGTELPTLSQRAATQLYRVAQEAVANAVKHAAAEQIVLDLGTAGGEVCLTVRDDGAGLRGDVTPGLGMRSMVGRAASLGGGIDWQPVPGGGTEVTCRVPARLVLEAA